MALAASSSRGGGGGGERSEAALSSQLQWKKWKERETSPERTPVWTESHHKVRSNNGSKVESRVALAAVPVVYYISRNGQLEHPHFMEIPLSTSHGLLLRDFINKLNLLRGKCMASRYSWSAKRSYRNGYVWHDLEEDDLIQPVNGQEYVLKGSEILLEPSSTTSTDISGCLISKSSETTESSSSSGKLLPLETEASVAKSGELRPEFPARNNRRRRNQSWSSSTDLHEYKVYKAEPNGISSGKSSVAADAGTQTEEKNRRHHHHHHRKQHAIIEEEEVGAAKIERSTEICGEEIPVSISPPQSESSPETLESLMKADGRLMLSTSDRCCRDMEQQPDGGDEPPHPSGKLKASSVLMSLISCGSMSFRDCTAGAGVVKDHGFSLVSHYKARLPNNATKEEESGVDNDHSCNVSVASNSFAKMAVLEDKEYFSGSLIETRKQEIPVLKRSSSYNADRSSSSDMKLVEQDREEGGGVRAMCIPRKLRITHHTNGKQQRDIINQDISNANALTQDNAKNTSTSQ